MTGRSLPKLAAPFFSFLRLRTRGAHYRFMEKCPLCQRELAEDPVYRTEEGYHDLNPPDHKPPSRVEFNCTFCKRYEVVQPLANRGFSLRDLWPCLSTAARTHWEATQKPLRIDADNWRHFAEPCEKKSAGD